VPASYHQNLQWVLIVGSSAGALIGLPFVILALIAEMPTARADAQASDAFSTPSVVHFGVMLLLAAVVSAPLLERCELSKNS
jgi:hypothetical protein